VPARPLPCTGAGVLQRGRTNAARRFSDQSAGGTTVTKGESQQRNWLIWLAKVRVIVITFLFGIEFAVSTLTTTNLPKSLFVSTILVAYAVSIFYILLLSVWRDSRYQARLHVLTDLALATVIVYLTGGIDSSFNFLFPLIIIVASILLARPWAFMTAALSFIASGSVLELSYFNLISSYSVTRPDLRSLQVSILINLFAYAAIAYLATQLSNKLRQADVRLEEQSGALENLQALHENVLNSMSGGLLTTGTDGYVGLVNAAGLRLLERSEREVIGKPVGSFFLERLPEPGPGIYRCEVTSPTPSSRQKTFGMTRSVLEVPERGAVGYVYTLDDLTEIRRLEREVRMRDRMAAVGRMAAGIAHEIRNPLASIAGSVKVLSAVSVLNQEQKTLVDIVNRESERLNNIISDFLTYSRDRKYQLTSTDLVPLLEDTLTLLENRADIKSAATLSIEREFTVPKAFAMADGDRMKQVFWNICDNAVRAMNGSGCLRVSLRAGEGNWLIAFADSGHGLQMQDVEKIFEPFQSEFAGGTGLGLAIVYQIVQGHEGKIGVKSRRGQGTEFTIQLRQAQAQYAEVAAAAQGGAARG
jgi:two-component system sensor histidine kinase PilS (NtrC family)